MCGQLLSLLSSKSDLMWVVPSDRTCPHTGIPGVRESRDLGLQGEKSSKSRENIQSHSFNKWQPQMKKVQYESQFHSYFFSLNPTFWAAWSRYYFPYVLLPSSGIWGLFKKTQRQGKKIWIWTQVYSHNPGFPLSHVPRVNLKYTLHIVPKYQVLCISYLVPDTKLTAISFFSTVTFLMLAIES